MRTLIVLVAGFYTMVLFSSLVKLKTGGNTYAGVIPAIASPEVRSMRYITEQDSLLFDYCGLIPDQRNFGADVYEIKLALISTQVDCYTQYLARWIIKFENTDVCNQKNPTSTAYGCGQFLDTTWNSSCIPRGYNNREAIHHQVGCVTSLIQTGELYTAWLNHWDQNKVQQFWALMQN